MGLLDRFRRKSLTASPAVVEALQNGHTTYQRLGGVNQQVSAAFSQAQSCSYAYMYERQPAVRTVVDYIARNTAQLGVKLFERVSDNERQRDTDHPAALTMLHPNDLAPADRFIFNFVADFLVHDNAYALKFRTANRGPRTLIQVPPPAVAIQSSGRFTIDSYRIYRSDGTFFDVKPEDVIHWRGYNPSDPRIGVSRLETLRLVLAEDAAAQSANVELMKSGLAKPGYIKRPLEAPEWSDPARGRFQESWANQAKGSSRKTPVLEEGMEFADFGVTPKDAEMLAGRRFTLESVARLYGLKSVPCETEEEHKQFYSDVLPPITEELASQLDFSILREEYGEDDHYFEFDLNEKLRGDLQNRSQALTAAAGRPWRTVNETRALENLPPVEDGDEMTIPLNVQVGNEKPALPAPNVMPIQDPNKPLQDGSERKALTTVHPRRKADMDRQKRYIDQAQALLTGYYARQARSIKGKAFDTERWNRELTQDLHKFFDRVVEAEGGIYAARLAGDDFDTRRVAHYLKATAQGVAEKLNEVTQRDLESMTAQEAVARAGDERAAVAAASIGTRATTFARREAAKQAPQTEFRKQVWIANTDRHGELDGVAVSLESDWGGISPGSEPHCSCSMSVE